MADVTKIYFGLRVALSRSPRLGVPSITFSGGMRASSASSEVKPENHRRLSQSPDVNFFSAPRIGRESLFSVRSDIRIQEMRDSH